MPRVLKCSKENGVAILTLNRPEVRNALSKDLRSQLRTTLNELDADETVRVVILTGADPAFCAGIDLGELRRGGEASDDVEPQTAPLLASRTPLIGAVNGAAYTGGLEMALACHFLVASERATFADTHALLGLMPGWGMSVLLAGAVGRRRAREMSVSCQPIDAGRALEWGLVNRVVAHEDLLPTCLAIAQVIVGNDPTAVRSVSQLLDDQASVADAAAWRLEARAWTGSRPVS